MRAFFQFLTRGLEPEGTVENLAVAPAPAPPLDAAGLDALDAAIEDLFDESEDAQRDDPGRP